ncbi:hypothetical protein, partial [Salmonella enterica]|uniref:hypothetical protein n=1 Tax=Salmonella enterica TaxID=28901 RepID=UPI00329839C2
MFVRKYTPSGNVAWTQQFHYSSYDVGVAIAVSGSSVYMVGQFYFNASASTDVDVRLLKLTTGGGVVWSTYYGSGYDQSPSDLSVV